MHNKCFESDTLFIAVIKENAVTPAYSFTSYFEIIQNILNDQLPKILYVVVFFVWIMIFLKITKKTLILTFLKSGQIFFTIS